ncbi:NAD(+) diphosphatase [Polymorphospora rubra]|uniref:NAD(+) diphosphatase n=1 Tax=Polymorphospora rubra TaxID=338584 RepID=UPI0033E98726
MTVPSPRPPAGTVAGGRFVPDALNSGPAAPDDLCLLVDGRKLLVASAGGFPAVRDLPAGTEWIPLGTLDGARVWAGALPTPQAVPAAEAATTDAAVAGAPGLARPAPADGALGDWLGWPRVAAELGEPYAALASRALQVMTWRRTHRFCGACATELADVPGEHARRCPSCAVYVPMQLSPAVLAAIRRPGPAGGVDELLLVRHTYGPTEIWALVAGFVEAGESLEEAVHREVGEEVGLTVDRVTYFGSQPWAMSGPGVVLAGFHAVCAAGAEPVVDGTELADARWFPLDRLPDEIPPTYSISRWLIDDAVRAAAPRS